MTLATHILETRAAALLPEHPWDVRALEWPLTAESVVFEVGGYKGRWALQIAQRYHPRLFVFEPQPWAAAVCREVLGEAAQVFEFGLGDRTATLPMTQFETDGCRFAGDGDGQGHMRDMAAVIKELDTPTIDLMLMNIEGYEYTLLPYMLDNNILPTRLMVQWHAHADPDDRQFVAINLRMARHYRLRWAYGHTLMAWEAR